MRKQLSFLTLAACMSLMQAAAQTQTPISAYAEQACLYADIDGDGVMEHIEKLDRIVYDYPQGALPNIPEDGRYFTLITEDRANIRIIDGVYYYFCHYDPSMTMSDYLPADREPDMKESKGVFGDGEKRWEVFDYWFRFTSQEDVDTWLGPATSSNPMTQTSGIMYSDGKLYGIASEKAPSHYDNRVAWVDFNGLR